MTGRVLVTYGSRRGGTAGLAEAIAQALRDAGHQVDCAPAGEVRVLDGYGAVVIGGALYAARWAADARRFVARHAAALRARPVWMFSSGPLDASAGKSPIPPVRQVAGLMARVGARGHATFGGRLARDAKGWIASKMAATHAGDWRDWDQVRRWAGDLAEALVREPAPAPRPGGAPAPASPLRWLVAALCLITGATAVAGGAVLVAAPDGSIMNIPPAELAHTPFSSFLIPGLLLLIVIGLGSLIAGLMVARRSRHAADAGLVAGVGLLVWMISEMVLMRTANGLQLAYVAIAVVTTAAALPAAVRAHRLQPRTEELPC